MSRVLRFCLALVFVLQLFGAHHHGAGSPAPIDAKAAAIASLAAEIGQPVTLCEHKGDPTRPADQAACDRCIFCHSLAAGDHARSGVAAIWRVAMSTGIEPLREDVRVPTARHVGSSTPRGPPSIG